MLLFAVCRQCGSKAVKVQKVLIGSYLRIKQLCSRCGQKCVWDSQPMIRKIPAGNIRLSTAILYAGALPTKVIRVLTFLKCETISVDTFDIKGISYNLLFLVCTVQNRRRYSLVLEISIWETAKQTALDTVPNMEHTQLWKCHVTRLLTSNLSRCVC